MKLPNFSLERKLWKSGYRIIAGVDEVGRGALAGSVIAGCVVFAANSNYQFPIFNQFLKKININDSKQLTPRQREKADKWIRQNALSWGIGEASVAAINRLGIVKATQIAFRHAIAKCKVDFLLIDAFYIPYVKGLPRKNPACAGRQKAIIKGDTKSISIAAASIIAKVYRDKLMLNLNKQAKYKKYGWGRNKGYGTLEHRTAIKKYGVTKLHRKQFVKGLIDDLSKQPI
jgi:ribonuclease HII